eukprot:TRINITY_DN14857_c0_g1_i1.p1 TRINITY_DN14857_c0_g1~~TRINITY_DN14857_c0_g1_i1.p1  ORF type:complete len:682 (+),score=122.70 TRINITY_DN14857_c0_g1_i1:27-2072(+)
MDKLVSAKEYKGKFLRASHAWISSVHENNSGDTPINISHAHAAYVAMHVAGHQPNVPPPPTNDEYLRKISCTHILNRQNMDWDHNRFPGTMAVSLGRRHVPLLQNNDYFITEKTDGLRVMFLNLYDKNFPRWVYISNHGHITYFFTLAQNLIIEDAYQKNLTSEKVTLQIDNHLECDFNFKEKKITNKNGVELLIRRDLGWSFSYVFDRNFTFYLCTEEYLFPTRQCLESFRNAPPAQSLSSYSYHEVLILDGEVVQTLPQKHDHTKPEVARNFNYTVYDVITCTMDGKQTYFGDKSLRERQEVSSRHVINPHHWLTKTFTALQKQTQLRPRTLQILAKHFYTKAEISLIFGLIQRTEEGEYIYKNYNKNDGLVFTPNDPAMSRYFPGTNDYMLKWKWPDKLTVDFRIKSRGSSTNLNLYSLFFIEHKEIHYRDSNLRFELSNADMRALGTSKNGDIVECKFDRSKGEWVVVGRRTDKNTPNSFRVVANTLESLFEDLSSSELQRLLSTDPGPPPPSLLLTTSCRAHFYMTTRPPENSEGSRGNSREFVMNLSVNVDNRTIWKPYRVLGNIPDSPHRLGAQLIAGEISAIFPQVVICEFLPQAGEWDLVELRGNADEHLASSSQLLRSLEDSLKNPQDPNPSSASSSSTPPLPGGRGVKRSLTDSNDGNSPANSEQKRPLF